MSLARKLQRPWYALLQFICRLLVTVLFGYRSTGQRHLPDSGGALVLSSHQSFLDPVLIGVPTLRPLNYLARETLFRFAPLRWLIQSLSGIPIDREGLGMAGLKETLRRLKRGQIVVIYPEGTRTTDGAPQSLKPGFAALARRAGVPLVPAAIVGAFECWPRTQQWPGRGQIRVHFGQPMSPEALVTFDDRALVAEVERRIAECHQGACAARSQCLAWRCQGDGGQNSGGQDSGGQDDWPTE
jgi:1-acyl-sn-glycerol-3-phosphate acyltransferase